MQHVKPVGKKLSLRTLTAAWGPQQCKARVYRIKPS
jgi:hypothetical protein